MKASQTRYATMRHGFTLVECTVSVILVGILMATALRCLSTSQQRNSNTLQRMQARELCESFYQEIYSRAFAEPSVTATQLGLDSGELHTLRTGLDDVDDFNNLNLSPPTDARGNAIPGFSEWRVAVFVSWADPNTLGNSLNSNSNLKRIEVQAWHSNRMLTSITGYRAADDL